MGASWADKFQPRFGQVATGGYVGAGGHAITGVGFKPTFALVFNHGVGGPSYTYPVYKSDQVGGVTSFIFSLASAGIADGITSLDEDGFTVGGNNYTGLADNSYSWIAIQNSTGVV